MMVNYAGALYALNRARRSQRIDPIAVDMGRLSENDNVGRVGVALLRIGADDHCAAAADLSLACVDRRFCTRNIDCSLTINKNGTLGGRGVDRRGLLKGAAVAGVTAVGSPLE
jgi:hypothetical protein